MKNVQLNSLMALLFAGILLFGLSCEDEPVVVDPGESNSELLAKSFDKAPVLDGTVDDVWSQCQTLVGTATVPNAGSRGIADFNGDGSPGPNGVFDPYTGESNDFKLRSGTFGNDIFFLLEWDDAEDSKDRQSWYFDPVDSRWKGQHKYANDDGDKYYEDKFAFLWAATEVEGFAASTCYATCHQGLTVTDPSQKAARHYTNNVGEIVDMWHWKRVRSTYAPTTVDDQQMVYKDDTGDAGQNGRTGDLGSAGYHNNKQALPLDGNGADVNVPLYVIPGRTEYYWITKDEIADGTAKVITAVASDGTLTYDGGTINPADGGYEDGVGNKRLPSVWVESFTESRADIAVAANHTGSGWVVEFSRKLDTGYSDDVVFDTSKEIPFGLALFNNAAIAHEIKNNLLLKFEK
jgi:hypothetical protein